MQEIQPSTLRKLPESYDIVATDEQMQAMKAFGMKLRQKHPRWKNDRFMRKVFEKFPTVKIRMK